MKEIALLIFLLLLLLIPIIFILSTSEDIGKLLLTFGLGLGLAVSIIALIWFSGLGLVLAGTADPIGASAVALTGDSDKEGTGNLKLFGISLVSTTIFAVLFHVFVGF